MSYDLIDLSHRWTGWFISSNHLGAVSSAYLVAVIGMICWFWSRHHHYTRIPIILSLAIAACFLVLALAWSGSRGAWLGLSCGLVVSSIIVKHRQFRVISIICILAVATAVVLNPRSEARAKTLINAGNMLVRANQPQ